MKKEYIKPEVTKEELRSMLMETNEKLVLLNEQLEESNENLSKVNAELERAYEKLRRQEKERGELFANLSHDLRSSVSIISSSAELLRTSGLDDAEEEEILELIEKRSGFMQRLIEDMFLLAKLESRQREIQLRRIDVRGFLEEFFFSVQAGDLFQNRKLVLDIPDDFCAEAEMDPELIVRVLDNLFTNALKYSEDGAEIVLSVKEVEKPCAECAPDSVIQISVRDTGIGISAEDLPRIFDRSFRSSRARTPEDGSSGLGLSIVKSIVEQHGGTVFCESEPGVGSCFVFTIKSKPCL
ncbi:MAG: HAMP domain-containing histidine kinase [Parasporobacterium sp.]|nr:HAMP domain-containing histidine kinase [Parasporobacterium sp.]MBR3641874.1 HAMP domain-containing histidine kinase [Parasporobacterium sp.]